MIKLTNIILLLTFFLVKSYSQNYSSQSRLEIADKLLSSNFKTFYSVDTELAMCMGSIIEDRIISELKDSSTFKYKYDSLAKQIKIIVSEDSMLRTFSWDGISGGSWHDMKAYAQYKTDLGKIKYKKLYSGDEGGTGEPTDVSIYKIHTIDIQNETHYLLLGWGTHGGGEHHTLARVYNIKGDTLSLCDSIFNGQKYLYVGARRIDKIELKYDPELKTISYNHYEPDDNIGTYKRNSVKVKWVLKEKEFIKVK